MELGARTGMDMPTLTNFEEGGNPGTQLLYYM